jgi:SAM-dependent methyltransferase
VVYLNNDVVLQPTRCAICGTVENSVEIYTANFDFEAFNPATFSARRLPDQIHYRIVKCKSCGLLRSDPIAPSELLEQLYIKSDQTYNQEIENLMLTYGHYLAKLDKFVLQKQALLEIGCGSGFFLERALKLGYENVYGVEPSVRAVSKATSSIRSNIKIDIFRPGLFSENTFDVICFFQVFDHLIDPNASLSECYRILKPGGLLLGLNHNSTSLSAKLLGERSPIIDIEHTYLYNPKTMSYIINKNGFHVIKTGAVWNNYSLQYLFQLIPMLGKAKLIILGLLRKTKIGQIRLKAFLGNLYIIARKIEHV